MRDWDLKNHIWKSYLGLRIGLAVLGIVLPFYLWLGGRFVWGVPLQNSISAYYHAFDGELRNEFVGVLMAVAALLIFYRGYSWWEDWALNLGGACLAGVALIPMAWPEDPSYPWTRLHGPLAIGFFLMAAYVAVCRSWDTLKEMDEGRLKTVFRWLYKGFGALMVLLPFVVLLINWMASPGSLLANTVFWLEAGGIWTFGCFWTAKTCELRITRYEQGLLRGEGPATEPEGCGFCPPILRWLKGRKTGS